jgi:putative copper export protein
MTINPNAPILIIITVSVWVGGYLILRPRQYKDELRRSGDDVISRFSPWAVRALGVFIIVFSLGMLYLAFRPST